MQYPEKMYEIHARAPFPHDEVWNVDQYPTKDAAIHAAQHEYLPGTILELVKVTRKSLGPIKPR